MFVLKDKVHTVTNKKGQKLFHYYYLGNKPYLLIINEVYQVEAYMIDHTVFKFNESMVGLINKFENDYVKKERLQDVFFSAFLNGHVKEHNCILVDMSILFEITVQLDLFENLDFANSFLVKYIFDIWYKHFPDQIQ